ncbi:hypothetical protein ACFQZO_14005 [Bradyrhizobium sp. GCM10027634]|uniref:hypothetical protein n=1 Tax=unclassified Bradyrhizobium TaxID=2631580 RepID=UPI00188C9DF9|nr:MULTISPECIES: hypothetical protein [unclassified Bradyrhizobium]MDN5002002.1 hypothetical protein [Bradyrhizobium sp. WYCCWR 12677]QOZ45719.1 hypothetical protein XH89_21220 [Bradyrhizobium sp. CCBAU 53340]
MSVRIVIPGTAAVAALVAAYVAMPRQADLRAFDPAEMARLETAMWRDYYDKRYATLFYHLHVALSAAEAAKAFQPTQSRQEADAALPALVAYYRDFAPAAPVAFDVEQAARLELDWWQARREAVVPQDYGLTIGRVTALTYGESADDPGIRQFGIARAEAMAFRDARGQAITEADWTMIESRLGEAYRLLKASVSR